MGKHSGTRSRFRLLHRADVLHALLLGLIVGSSVLGAPHLSSAQTDRDRDGLRGPVHQVVIEKIRAAMVSPRDQGTFERQSEPFPWQQDTSPLAPPGGSPGWPQRPRLLWRTMAYGTIYLETVDCATSNPSLSNSPWIRGAPHKGLARLMSRMRSRNSGWTFGRPARPFDFQRQ